MASDCSSGCKWFHTLSGTASLDWGVCGNPQSHRVGLLTFEHKVLAVSSDGCTATIQSFSLSKQFLFGGPMTDIPCSTLSHFREDASQAGWTPCMAKCWIAT
jgi:hypothetical protein